LLNYETNGLTYLGGASDHSKSLKVVSHIVD